MSVRFDDPFGRDRRPARLSKGEKAAAVLVGIVVVIGAFFAEAWLLMMLSGALHLEVWDKVPAFGFFQMLFIIAALHVVAAYFNKLTR